MPKIPLYGQQKVEQSAAPNVRVSTDAPIEAFGGGKANPFPEVAQAANTFSKLAFQAAQEANRTSYELNKQEIDRFLADQYKDGYFTKKGIDAIGRPGEKKSDPRAELDDQYAKLVSNLDKTAPNDEVRRALSGYAANKKNALDIEVAKHFVREEESVKDGLFKASVKFSGDNIERFYSNVKAIDQELASIEDQVVNKYKNAGHGVVVENYRTLARDGITRAIERAVTNEELGVAHALKKRYNHVLAGNDQEIDELLKTTGNRKQAHSLAIEGYDKFDSSTSFLEHLREKGVNPEVINEAMNKFNFLNNERNKNNEAAKQFAFGSAVETLEQNKWDYSRLSPVVLRKLNPSQQRTIKKLAEIKASGKEPVTDKHYFNMMMNKSDYDLASLTQEDLMVAATRLDSGAFKKLNDYVSWAKAKTTDDAAAAKFNATDEDRTMVFNELRSLGKLKQSKSKDYLDDHPEEMEVFSDVMEAYDKRIQTVVAKTQGKTQFSDEEKKAIVRDVLKNSTVQTETGFIFKSAKKVPVSQLESPEDISLKEVDLSGYYRLAYKNKLPGFDGGSRLSEEDFRKRYGSKIKRVILKAAMAGDRPMTESEVVMALIGAGE